MTLPPNEILARLGGAAALGAIIGINRELSHKPAGLRTHALVSLGSALITLLAVEYASVSGTLDPNALSRALQGIITGVGFLGAGVILHREDTQWIHGLTTAASIWVVSALGVAAGGGHWFEALAGLVLVLVVLIVGGWIERALLSWWARHKGKEPPTF